MSLIYSETASVSQGRPKQIGMRGGGRPGWRDAVLRLGHKVAQRARTRPWSPARGREEGQDQGKPVLHRPAGYITEAAAS